MSSKSFSTLLIKFHKFIDSYHGPFLRDELRIGESRCSGHRGTSSMAVGVVFIVGVVGVVVVVAVRVVA